MPLTPRAERARESSLETAELLALVLLVLQGSPNGGHEGSHETAMVPNAGAAAQDLPQVYNLREVADNVRDMAAISELPGRPPGETTSWQQTP